MKKNKKAFTLVELIVVLIIIVILGTIAYYSLQGHNKDARNSIRISALTSFEEQLELYSVKTGGLPIPEDYVEIYSSGVLIGYQGYLGEKILGLLNIKGGKDPLDEEYYTYIVDTKRRNFEIMAFLEESEMIFNIPKNIYADNSKRTPYVKGKKVGIIVNQTNDPIQKLITGSFDIANTNDIYKSYLNNETIITGTGIELRKASPTYSCERIFELSKKTITGNYNIDNHYSTGSSTLNINCDLDLDGLTPIIKDSSGTAGMIIRNIKFDNNGYIYVVGSYSGNDIIFGEPLNASTLNYYFLAKLDSNLKLIWIKSGAGSGNNYLNSIDIDSNNNIIVGGYFQTTATIFGDSLTSNGGADYFLTKLDSDGNKIWTKNGGGSGSDIITNVNFDGNNNIILGGYFQTTATIFGDSLTSNGGYDYFLSKLDSDGNKIWTKNGGGSGNDIITNVNFDGNNNIILGGYFQITATIFGDSLTSNGGYDYFLSKLDSDGNKIWTKNGGGSLDDIINNVNFDGNNNIILGGYFQTTATIFGDSLTSNGGYDYFLSKLDSDGNKIWTKNGGGSGDEFIENIMYDNEGNIYLSLYYTLNSTIFGNSLISNGGYDYYFVKLDSNGNKIWSKNGGGNGNDRINVINIDNNGDLFLGGLYFSSSVDFFGNNLSSINGTRNIVLIKLFK